MPSLRSFTQRLSLLLLFGFLAPFGTGFAAEAEFYTLNDRWAKSNLPAKSTQDAALEEGFSQALSNQNASYIIPGAPPTPSIRRSLQEILSAGGAVEVEVNQSLFVEGINGLIKFVTTDEGIAILENDITSGTLRIQGTSIGSTFVHVWHSAGRSTFALRVLQPKLTTSSYQARELDKFEKTRPFRFGYDNARSASYTGEKFRVAERSSLDFIQDFSLGGDTPYGELYGHAQTQKAVGKNLLSDAQVTLSDGKVGPLKNFNATAGDASVGPALMVFPSARVRGLAVEHWDDKKRVNWSTFRGRQNSSIIGTLTPGVSERTLNSYLTGGVMDFKVNDSAKIKTGYFQGSGIDRPDELHGHGAGVQSEIKLGEHVVLSNETDFDSERYAQKHAATVKFEHLRVRNEFRDINRHFQTLIGAPSRQGEVGNLLEVYADPSPLWSATGSLDLFHDRLIPNPDRPDALNMHSDLILNYTPCDDVSWSFNFQDLDDTARLGPSRQRTMGGQYNEHFDIWGHKATFFGRYQYRTNQLLANSDSNYRQNQVVLGLYTQIFWGINFSLQKEWNALEEMEIGRYTHPNALVYSWDYSHQIGNSPIFMEARLRIRDEESTESTSSFMAGEDSTELSGGFYYREFEDIELFLTGGATQYVPESLNVLEPRVETHFYTGMRTSFDTGFRWGAVGSFEGYVYKDQNGDGTKQPYEPGLAGLLLTSLDGKQAVTDENGYYQIKGVSGKQTTLTLDSSKIPYGFVPTSSLTQPGAITQNKTTKVDFGLTPRSEVTGIIFNDLNGNGKYDLTDPGVGKARVTLENGAVTKSNTLGVYTFSGVVAGEHTASLALATLPEGYLPYDVPKKTFTLYEGIRYELNFPLKATRALTGRVFLDENMNNVFDPNETALSDIPVLFAGRSAVSDQEGWYLFDALDQGSFELVVDPAGVPAGFLAPGPVKIEMPVGALTMSDINIPLKVNPGRLSQTEEAVYVKSAE